jgi:hypothetical protein
VQQRGPSTLARAPSVREILRVGDLLPVGVTTVQKELARALAENEEIFQLRDPAPASDSPWASTLATELVTRWSSGGIGMGSVVEAIVAVCTTSDSAHPDNDSAFMNSVVEAAIARLVGADTHRRDITERVHGKLGQLLRWKHGDITRDQTKAILHLSSVRETDVIRTWADASRRKLSALKRAHSYFVHYKKVADTLGDIFVDDKRGRGVATEKNMIVAMHRQFLALCEPATEDLKTLLQRALEARILEECPFGVGGLKVDAKRCDNLDQAMPQRPA